MVFPTNLASLEESGETRAAASSSRPSTGLQFWSQPVVWQQPPQRRTPDLHLLQSDRCPPPGREARDSRSCDQGESQAAGRPEVGLRIRVQGEAGPSANTALVGPPPCAPSPPVHLPTLRSRARSRQPPYLRTLHFLEECLFPSITPDHCPRPAPHTPRLRVWRGASHPRPEHCVAVETRASCRAC